MTASKQPTVYEAFAAVMGQVQGISKGERVQSGPSQFNFRGIDAVMNHVGPALREHGVVIVPTAEHIDTERYPTRNGGQMQGVIVRVRYTVFGPAGDSFSGVAFGQASDAGDKAVSKAHSVAYRTFLLQALTVPTDEPDPDREVHERAARQDSVAGPPDPKQMARDRLDAAWRRLGEACRDVGITLDEIKAWAIHPGNLNRSLDVVTDPKVYDDLAARVVAEGRALLAPPAEPTPDEAKAAVQTQLDATEVPS